MRVVAKTAEDVISSLADAGETLALAESLTGGLLCARLTDVPGASRVILGGVVAYSTRSKHEVLGVPNATLRDHGAVSAQTAAAMATAVAHLFSARIGVATTGVAGPDSQEGQDVGTVFLAIARGEQTHVVQLALEGTREQIRALTVDHAFALLTSGA